MFSKSQFRCISHPFAISSAELSRWRAWVSKVVHRRVDAHIMCRTRMGIAFSIVGVSLLIGTPIEGALLPSRDGRYVWDNSIIFCAVGDFFHFIRPLSETSV